MRVCAGLRPSRHARGFHPLALPREFSWQDEEEVAFYVTTRSVRLIRPPFGNSFEEPNRIRSTP